MFTLWNYCFASFAEKGQEPSHVMSGREKATLGDKEQQPTATYEKVPHSFRKKATRNRKQQQHTKRQRKQHPCCIENCSATVVNLPRHLRQIHVDLPEFEVQELIRRRKKKPKRQYKVMPHRFRTY